eukprot:6509005-Prymnesium_polylepis.1
MHVSPRPPGRPALVRWTAVGWRRTDAARLVDSGTPREPSCAPFQTPCQTEVPVPRYALLQVTLPIGTTCDRLSATARARAS